MQPLSAHLVGLCNNQTYIKIRVSGHAVTFIDLQLI